MMKIPTKELSVLIKQNKRKVFEVSISRNGFKATHFISWGGKRIYDTGIDSQEVIWIEKDFLKNYEKSIWLIEQIV